LDEKNDIVLIVFSFDFEGEMNFFCSSMCTWKKMWLKEIWNNKFAKISTLCKLQMIKHCHFPTFFEVPSFVPLSCDTIFKSNFSPCTNVCSPTFYYYGDGC
jgi:hypothetical protein